VLRPFCLADAPDVQRLAGDFAIADTTSTIPHPYKDGMAEQWIATHQDEFEAGLGLTLAITLVQTRELVGAIGLVIRPEADRAEIGYWVGRPYWDRGYCTEAGRAVLEYAFQVLKLNRVHAYHFSRNPASGRVMQKLGMRHEGCARQHLKKWGAYEDLESYGILKGEWIKNGPAAR
jgi:RimJ/RimL family protein N-acetyltransferase